MTAATAGADSKCQTPRRRLAALTLARVLTALIYGYLSSS